MRAVFFCFFFSKGFFICLEFLWIFYLKLISFEIFVSVCGVIMGLVINVRFLVV